MKIVDVSWECARCHRVGRFRVFGSFEVEHIPQSAIAKDHLHANSDCAMTYGAKELSWTTQEGEIKWPK